MSWVYIKSESDLWTVGHEDSKGKWHPDSDHTKENDAAKRVHYLNGGTDNILADECRRLTDECKRLIESVKAAVAKVEGGGA